MMKSIYSIILLSLVNIYIVVCGCAPVIYDYHKPIANSGKISSDFGIFAPNDLIKFSFNKVKITVAGSYTGIYLTMTVPKGKFVRFVSDELEWHVRSSKNGTKTKFHLLLYNMRSGKYIKIKPTEIMVQKVSEIFLNCPGSCGYQVPVKLFDTHKDHYFIKLPAIEIDNQVFQIPTIEFIKKKGFGIIPIND
ncbi:MAG: hypothetical protein GY834_12660 [Bacteroidetes bacterium]|nr:hypothetical protein [Bacteroidota bacterium]